MNKTVSLIFSKDRALQLRANLESFISLCKDVKDVDVYVLYKVTKERTKKQYDKLIEIFQQIQFIPETVVANQIKTIISKYSFLFFQCDDNMFIRNFEIKEPVTYMTTCEDVLGFSLRLSPTITHCYMQRCRQRIPKFFSVDRNILKFDWTKQEHSFGYALEVTSSIYRVSDILPHISVANMSQMFLIEGYLYNHRHIFEKLRPYTLCYSKPVKFNLPINNISGVVGNRAGETFGHTVDELIEKFDQGLKIDTVKFLNFDPISAQQEVPIDFIKE